MKKTRLKFFKTLISYIKHRIESFIAWLALFFIFFGLLLEFSLGYALLVVGLIMIVLLIFALRQNDK